LPLINIVGGGLINFLVGITFYSGSTVLNIILLTQHISMVECRCKIESRLKYEKRSVMRFGLRILTPFLKKGNGILTPNHFHNSIANKAHLSITVFFFRKRRIIYSRSFPLLKKRLQKAVFIFQKERCSSETISNEHRAERRKVLMCYCGARMKAPGLFQNRSVFRLSSTVWALRRYVPLVGIVFPTKSAFMQIVVSFFISCLSCAHYLTPFL